MNKIKMIFSAPEICFLGAGTIYVNEYFAGEMASPFGEVKKSGIGRKRGLETLANYTRVKNVIINIR